jgi:PII-like signaling protein
MSDTERKKRSFKRLDPLAHRLKCIDKAPKEMVINWLIRHKWSTKPETQLKKYKVEALRYKLLHSVVNRGTMKDVQLLEDAVLNMDVARLKQRERRVEGNRAQRDHYLTKGKQQFIEGATVYIFDEQKVGHDQKGRKLVKSIPIEATVVEVKNSSRNVKVRINRTREWYEAGGWWVYKGQELWFNFDHVTNKWLREGLTPEVCRSFGADGKPEYFKLSYTRQFLLLQ